MQLYIWTGEDVLKNWGTGMAGALAESVDEARRLIHLELTTKHYDYLDVTDTDDLATLREKLAFLDRPPTIDTDAPTAFYQSGSE